MSTPHFLNTREVAKVMGVSPETINRHRMLKSPDSPPHVRIGSRVLYPVAALEAWIDARLIGGNMGVAR